VECLIIPGGINITNRLDLARRVRRVLLRLAPHRTQRHPNRLQVIVVTVVVNEVTFKLAVVTLHVVLILPVVVAVAVHRLLVLDPGLVTGLEAGIVEVTAPVRLVRVRAPATDRGSTKAVDPDRGQARVPARPKASPPNPRWPNLLLLPTLLPLLTPPIQEQEGRHPALFRLSPHP